jgi:hypothetical protein
MEISWDYFQLPQNRREWPMESIANDKTDVGRRRINGNTNGSTSASVWSRFLFHRRRTALRTTLRGRTQVIATILAEFANSAAMLSNPTPEPKNRRRQQYDQRRPVRHTNLSPIVAARLTVPCVAGRMRLVAESPSGQKIVRWRQRFQSRRLSPIRIPSHALNRPLTVPLLSLGGRFFPSRRIDQNSLNLHTQLPINRRQSATPPTNDRRRIREMPDDQIIRCEMAVRPKPGNANRHHQ